ncbi:PucR family transcriptional regulator ligand-binding domain-containing protein [Streptomyces sp. ISL-1]|uniref:PucR family transcriptional regulator ligand-binding domain-containing protein n=1 Tax=Streptomyces sp. ISL-1 TaxID=2817657 RepID=UPI0020352E21|nr:PucR family transcriptional regulator ligand-binding domain-containing protein [Streptomyces sp. ISL-1]
MPEIAAAPPTPPIPLAALLAREELGLRQIAGPVEAGAAVHWVHTSEMADPYPYLLGGELLLSAGVLLKDPDMYVSRIVQAGAAALGFGVAPVYDTVPQALIEACDRHGLPLIEVPPPTTFTAVARAVWRLMAEARHRELRRVTQAQQGLAAAAARPDPVPAVLHQLAARLGGKAVLLAPDGTELSSSGRAPGPDAGAALRRLARVVNRRPAAEEAGRSGAFAGDAPAGSAPGAGEVPKPAPASGTGEATRPVRGTGGATRPVRAAGEATRPVRGTGTGEAPRPARGIDEATRPVPASASDAIPGAHLAAYALGGHQGLVLGLATPRREAGDHTVAGVAVVLLSLLTAPHQGADSSGRSAALVRLLLGAGPAEAAALLGADRWTVVHARGGSGTPFAASALGAALGSALVDPADDGAVRILLPADSEVTPQPGWVLGVSSPVRPDELAAADTQAARAVHRAAATSTDLVRHRGTSLSALLAPEEAAAHARLRLAPLADSPALLDTLRNWLSLHGSWDRTAAAMEIHRNTVRQRIARCAALLDEDLDDADVRMELWFALRHT